MAETHLLRAVPTMTGNPNRGATGSYVAKLERTVRWQRIAIGALVGSVVAMAGVYGVLLPLKSTDVRFVDFKSKDEQVVFLQPGQITLDDRTVFTRKALREYVTARESIDHVTEKSRDDWLRFHTDPDWFVHFLKQMANTNPQSPRIRAASAGVTREIHTVSATKIPSQANTWQVFYIAIDRRSGTEINRSEWIATMNVYYRPIKTADHAAETNPLGITVANYAISKRDLEK